MKKNLLTALALAASLFALAQTQTFNYTGAMQTFTVPACVTSITIETYGAQGGNATIGGTGGLGGYAIGTLNVTPGDVLNIYVGGQNGYNGGGTGGQDGNSAFSGPPGNLAPSGGGASDVRLNGTAIANRVIVAGGGGGAGSNGTWPGCQVAGPAGNGGAGGGLTGSTGSAGVGTPCNCAGGGGDGATGGSQVAGGIHGNYAGNTACLRANWTAGQDGTLAQGGNGSLIYYNGTGGGGGGGGGYYGGGSGGNGSDTTPGGGGGGGSSWTGTLTSASTTSGTRSGNGMVVLTYNISGSLPASPTGISGTSAVCVGGGTLAYSITSVPGATSYTWTVPSGSTINSGQGTSSVVIQPGSTSGNITVTANNACGSSAPATFSLTINPLPTVTATAASPAICTGSSDVLTASGASTYSWSSGGNASVETVSPTSMATYTVTGTDANGCVNTATVSVNVNPLPTVSATAASSTICSGSSDVLTASGASTYAWSSGGNAATETVMPTSTSTYTVTGTDANGCVNTATVSVMVNPLPTVTATASSSSICNGNGDTLTATGASTYAWSSGGNAATENVAPSSTTTYTVTGTDVNGCVNTATVTVTVNALPDVIASTTSSSLCMGDSTTIMATGASSYIWQPGAMTNATENVSPSSTTTYTVVGTDANGCTDMDIVTITVNPVPVLTTSASNLSPCLSDAPVTLTASPGGGTWSGPGVTGNSFNPATAGVGANVLTYNYTDSITGCSNSSQITITVNGCAGIPENTFSNAISVFPNPNAGTFTLTVNAGIGDLLIEITDVTGRVIYSSLENNVSSGFTKQISLENISSGLYQVKLSAGNEQKVQQISIVR